MREMYTQELTQLGNHMARMAHQVARAINRASRALEEGDVALAEQTIDADERIDALAYTVDETCTDLLALQAPVAGDLRLIVTGLRMAQTLERMGDLARNIAAVARNSSSTNNLPDEIADVLRRMGERARATGQAVSTLMDGPDSELATKIQNDDDLMDDLHVELHRLLLNPDMNLEPAQLINLTLVGRYYERFGDQATNVGRNIVYLIEGEMYRRAQAENL
ncbi:MAG TPA: phosphate signaling complex protein PhoU [Actinomyces sp.]|jgi:phosphate transport system protein|nr:phosphate signaling complex protein PhoU [Acidobacteriota bacterium]HHT40763.1 phosphate signaling complex protein PhoU [Actinomyces sp.]